MARQWLRSTGGYSNEAEDGREWLRSTGGYVNEPTAAAGGTTVARLVNGGLVGGGMLLGGRLVREAA